MPNGTLTVSTHADKELINITDTIEALCINQPVSSGILSLFNPHTTAGLTINEGADPEVCSDIIMGLEKMVPTLTYHHMEGNSPSHIMALLTGSSLTIHVEKGRLLLGTWQKIFFCEFDGPRIRTIHWKYLPDHG